jgi:hypothetical protein
MSLTSAICILCSASLHKVSHDLITTSSGSGARGCDWTIRTCAFITSYEDGKYYNIQRLVQLAGRNWLESRRELSRWSCEALKQVTKMFPFFTHEKRDKCILYLPHAQCIYGFRDFPEDITGLLAELVHNIGEYFRQTRKSGNTSKPEKGINRFFRRMESEAE